MDDIRNKTNEELERNMNYANNELPDLEAKIRIYGKIIGEITIDTIVRMVKTMYRDCNLYEYYKDMYNNSYDELERRNNNNAEDN